nr:Chain 4, human coxsackievirus A21 [Coxsackievirus A21]
LPLTKVDSITTF